MTRISTSACRTFALAAWLAAVPASVQGQTTAPESSLGDSSAPLLNMDAVYDRPFLEAQKFPVALGGYLEANTQYLNSDGVTEGFSFQFPRTTLFIYSTIHERIRFFTELEFEDGTEEIHLEAAQVDFNLHSLLTLRGGILVLPIGAFNQNHDGPKWEFVDRPLEATSILAATLSDVGFGLLGKTHRSGWTLGYEAYLSNGFDDRVISNEDNRTSLAAGKSPAEKFEESTSGLPTFTGKLAVRQRTLGELGLSYLFGVYNTWRVDGLEVDHKRYARALAVDFNTSLWNDRVRLVGEAAKVWVDVPPTYSQTFGQRQWGAFVDLVFTAIRRPLAGWQDASVNLALRVEYADYNQGTFRETGQNIADDVWALVPALSFRPVGSTVLKLNYRYQEEQDLLGNPPSKSAEIQFGMATYF